MTDNQQTFADFGVADPIVEALSDAGIVHPFPIQAMTLPVALSGADIIGQAKTGTGKTLGFGLPLLQRTLAPGEDGAPEPLGRAPQGLVVVPTRELAQQVAGDLVAASSKRPGLKVITIYGGKAFEPQLEALANGVDVIVGTPGRLLDLFSRRVLRLDKVRTAVFDEADEMLDLGFLPDVERIVAALPATRQTMLFSATMPGAVIALARRYMSRPTHIRASDPSDESQLNESTRQFAYRAHAMDKSEIVARILQAEGRGKTIVFARTKRTADRLGEELRDRGFEARALHGDINQQMREKALASFREGRISVLVATDVAARGIDIDDITHVVNYQCPEDEKIYVHRIGRTGRAGRSGTAVTLIDWDDMPRWSLISRSLKLDLDSPVETYSTSPHFFEDLSIPAGTKGRLSSRKPHAGEDGDSSGRSERRSSDSRSSSSRSNDSRSSGSRSSGSRSSGGRSNDSRSDDRRGTNDRDSERSSRTSTGGRSRKRTRGGENTENPAQSQAPVTVGSEDSASTEGRPRRRRRSRGGSGNSEQGSASSAQSASSATQD